MKASGRAISMLQTSVKPPLTAHDLTLLGCRPFGQGDRSYPVDAVPPKGEELKVVSSEQQAVVEKITRIETAVTNPTGVTGYLESRAVLPDVERCPLCGR